MLAPEASSAGVSRWKNGCARRLKSLFPKGSARRRRMLNSALQGEAPAPSLCRRRSAGAMRVLRQAASAGVTEYVDVCALQKASAVRAAANDVEDEKEGSMKIYCSYWIKEANKQSWCHCQLESGHTGDHKPPRSATGPHPVFEGIWHLPGEKETADQEPLIPCVPWVQESK